MDKLLVLPVRVSSDYQDTDVALINATDDLLKKWIAAIEKTAQEKSRDNMLYCMEYWTHVPSYHKTLYLSEEEILDAIGPDAWSELENNSPLFLIGEKAERIVKIIDRESRVTIDLSTACITHDEINWEASVKGSGIQCSCAPVEKSFLKRMLHEQREGVFGSAGRYGAEGLEAFDALPPDPDLLGELMDLVVHHGVDLNYLNSLVVKSIMEAAEKEAERIVNGGIEEVLPFLVKELGFQRTKSILS